MSLRWSNLGVINFRQTNQVEMDHFYQYFMALAKVLDKNMIAMWCKYFLWAWPEFLLHTKKNFKHSISLCVALSFSLILIHSNLLCRKYYKLFLIRFISFRCRCQWIIIVKRCANNWITRKRIRRTKKNNHTKKKTFTNRNRFQWIRFHYQCTVL